MLLTSAGQQFLCGTGTYVVERNGGWGRVILESQPGTERRSVASADHQQTLRDDIVKAWGKGKEMDAFNQQQRKMAIKDDL